MAERLFEKMSMIWFLETGLFLFIATEQNYLFVEINSFKSKIPQVEKNLVAFFSTWKEIEFYVCEKKCLEFDDMCTKTASVQCILFMFSRSKMFFAKFMIFVAILRAYTLHRVMGKCRGKYVTSTRRMYEDAASMMTKKGIMLHKNGPSPHMNDMFGNVFCVGKYFHHHSIAHCHKALQANKYWKTCGKLNKKQKILICATMMWKMFANSLSFIDNPKRNGTCDATKFVGQWL